jgi:hypothetical protein
MLAVASVLTLISALTLARWSLNSLRTACAIGIIIAVVAVLLIHIDRNAVVSMNPNMSLRK